jgi:hypothetical protein
MFLKLIGRKTTDGQCINTNHIIRLIDDGTSVTLKFVDGYSGRYGISAKEQSRTKHTNAMEYVLYRIKIDTV